MDLSRLYERVLLIVAHPDDETGGCGVLLQRFRDATVVFCTDGAPMQPRFWADCGSRERYALTREAEARRAMAIAGTRHVWFLREAWQGDLFRDQELHRAVANAIRRVAAAVVRYRPQALLTSAYEGGHPDHDSCSFIANTIGATYGLPIWEMPLYHRASDGTLVCQQFRNGGTPECMIEPTDDEWQRKLDMLSQYASQPDLWTFIQSPVECFRRQPRYDYSRPPHEGELNYEAWRWPVTGTVLCEAFAHAVGAGG
jgi:N-acetylglucosamine malate deacetylase 2